MSRTRFIPLAMLALLAACNVESTAPRMTVPDANYNNVAPKPGAHFQSATAAVVGADLVASFREVGLGEGNVTITLYADATANYACMNNGGQFPNDAKKQSISGPVSSTGVFPVAKNGHIDGSLTVSAPASTLECPNGQHVVTTSVSYTNVSLTDVTNQVMADIPGTFSAVFYANVP
jgi:hypothetical protein